MKGKRRSRGLLLCAVLLALLLAGLRMPGASAESSAAAQPGETRTGYFAEKIFLRPEPVFSMDYVDIIPPCTIVTVTVADGEWASYTTPAGKTGYVKLAKMLPVPEYEADEEHYVYGESRVQVRMLPIYDSPVVYTAAAYELLTVDGHVKGFRHVRAEDGTEGYILPRGTLDAVFTPEPIEPVTLCVAEETGKLDMPLRGAHPAGTLTPDRFYTAEGTCGEYYALKAGENWEYVPKSQVVLCAWKGGNSRVFFRKPRGVRGKAGIETVFLPAVTGPEGGTLVRPWAEELPVPGDARIYLYAAFGEWVGAAWGQEAGYLRRSEVRTLTAAVMQERLKSLDLSGGTVERNPLLDQAFAWVEAGNPFQARYNLLTGAETESLFPLGVPYFWGGRSYRTMIERLPEYTTREAWQSSPVFYQEGTTYLYGFDCIGFVKAAYAQAGTPLAGTLVGRRAREYCDAGAHIYCDDVHPLPEDWREAARTMRVGDIMIIHHPGTHAMMYMGTLRDYGYTAEQLPALADYLDYPLMLQAGANPSSYLRFCSLIEATGDARTASASPSDGGVGVCILGVPREAAEQVITCHDETYYCFDVEGCCVTEMGFGNVVDYFVFREGGNAARIPAAEDGAGADETEAAGDEDGPRGEAESAGDGETPEDGTAAGENGEIPEDEAGTAGDGENPEAEDGLPPEDR